MSVRSAIPLFLCVSLAIFSEPGSFADIRDTPHNFTRNNQGKRVGDKEVCAFCHTPAVTVSAGTKPIVPPVWQRSVGSDLVFTIYDDIGRLGLGKASVGSQSIACLSCHDSNQATGLGIGMGMGVATDGPTDDHPFGVPYRGFAKAGFGVAPLRTRGQNSAEAPFIAAKNMVSYEDFRDASSGTVEGRTVWWVSRSGVTARRGKGDLPLYVRAADGVEEVPYIECSSCHDPHSVNTTFLRVDNNDSRLCLTCHSK